MFYIKHNGTQIASVSNLQDAQADLNVFAGQGMELSSLTIEDDTGKVVFEKPEAPKNVYVTPKETGIHVDTAAIANQEIAKHVMQDAARAALSEADKDAILDGAAKIAHPSAAGTVATGLTGESNDATVQQAAAEIVPRRDQPDAAGATDAEQAQAAQEARDAGKDVPESATHVAPTDAHADAAIDHPVDLSGLPPPAPAAPVSHV